MIPFFRRIRKNIAYNDLPPGRESKTVQYIRYAIGEIILVVIGILIALQINNWNEARRLAHTELEIYRNLKRQLEEDTRIIQANINFNDHYRQQYKYALTLLQSNDRNHLDSLGEIAINLLENSDFHQQRNVYESLVNSGEIRLMHSKDILIGLQRLDETYVYINKMEEAHFDVIKMIYPDLNKSIRFEPLKVELPDLLFDFKFQNHFIVTIDITTEKEVVYKRAIQEIESILALIDQVIMGEDTP